MLRAPGAWTHAILPCQRARADRRFLSVLIYVYILLTILGIVISSVLGSDRPVVSRTLDLALGFLRDVAEPFLRIFRRFLPVRWDST